VADWWTGNNKRASQDTKTVNDFAYKIIHRRRALEKNAGGEGNGGGGDEVLHDTAAETEEKENEMDRSGNVFSSSGKDLMQLFMEATDDNGERLSDDALKDMLVNFLLVSLFVSFPFLKKILRPPLSLSLHFFFDSTVSIRAGYGCQRFFVSTT